MGDHPLEILSSPWGVGTGYDEDECDFLGFHPFIHAIHRGVLVYTLFLHPHPPTCYLLLGARFRIDLGRMVVDRRDICMCNL
jgi:hypothetical protein